MWFIDLDKKTPVKVDTEFMLTPFKDLNPSWSPDSKWIAYTKQLKSFFHAVFVFNLETGKAYPTYRWIKRCTAHAVGQRRQIPLFHGKHQ